MTNPSQLHIEREQDRANEVNAPWERARYRAHPLVALLVGMSIWIFTLGADCAPAVIFETLRLSNGPSATLCLAQAPSENATRHPVILTMGSLKPDELPDWSTNLLHEGFVVVAFAVEYLKARDRLL